MVLVELLIVVAIIAILVSLMVPAFLKAKSKARRVTCELSARQYETYLLSDRRKVYVIPQDSSCFDCHRYQRYPTKLGSERAYHSGRP